MMLWDLIRDFFVQFIFGGYSSSGDYFGGLLGHIFISGNITNTDMDAYSSDVLTPIGNVLIEGELPDVGWLSIGDWLSTTATIIILCLLIFVFIKITIWLFKQGANLFKW